MIRTRLSVSVIGKWHINRNLATIAMPKTGEDMSVSESAKSFREIPRISRTKLILGFLPGGRYYKAGLNELHRSIRDEYGKIVIMPSMLGKPEIVFTYSDQDNETILVNEGTWPNRYAFGLLKYFREKMRPDVYDGEYGSVASENGERWYKVRTLVNQVMLPPKAIQQYVQPIDEISTDFIKSVQRKCSGKHVEILGNEFNLWSLESIAYVTLDRKLGLFDDCSNDSRGRELIECVRKFFVLTVDFELTPSIWHYYETKAFKEYMEVNNRLLDIVMSYVEDTLNAQQKSPESSSRDGILQKLLRTDKRVAIIMTCDALFAGIDTTTSAIIGILYCLAKNPDKQETLRREILSAFPNQNEPIDAKVMANLPYLRSCIKEGLRLYPPVSGTARATQKELVLSGYKIPTGTNVVTWPQLFYRQEEFFPNGNEYMPERWLKNTDKACQSLQVERKFHFLPFGHGVRACPGKRIANMEMEVLLINLLRRFRVEWHQGDLKVKSVIVNIPDGDIRFRLVEL